MLLFVAALGLLGAASFLACCVDPEDDSVLGRFARFLTVSCPAGLIALAKLMHVWWVCRGTARVVNFFVNERHPIIRKCKRMFELCSLCL